MNKMLGFGLSLMLLIGSAFGESATLGRKKESSEYKERARYTLAILPFENQTGETAYEEYLHTQRKELLQTLYEKNLVRVIEIDQIEALVGEKATDTESYLKAVKTLQADTVLTISLQKVNETDHWMGRKKTEVHLNVHWTGLSTGEIIYMGTVTGSSVGKGDSDSYKQVRFSIALEKALHSLVKKISKKAKHCVV